VEPGGCSRALRRVLVDFGAETSFAKAAARTLEHHGVRVGAWRARAETYRHARQIGGLKPTRRAASAVLVAQIDGSMIPTLKPAQSGGDKRKARAVEWREVRACLARDRDSATPLFGATLASAEVAGLLWREVAQSAGLNESTRVHAIGDGAPWIVPQVQKHFGPQASYLVDFYHVSEYPPHRSKIPSPGSRNNKATSSKIKQTWFSGVWPVEWSRPAPWSVRWPRLTVIWPNGAIN
jgi:hypothetical protein